MSGGNAVSEDNLGALGDLEITKGIQSAGPMTQPTQGSSQFMDMMKNPMFQKYMANMGAGMQNQRDFGSALSSGLASANKGVSEDINKQMIQEEDLTAEDEKYKKLQEALKSYGLEELFNKLNTSQLYKTPKTVGLLKGK